MLLRFSQVDWFVNSVMGPVKKHKTQKHLLANTRLQYIQQKNFSFTKISES